MSARWGTYDESDLPGLTRLATACLAADGGLPLLAGQTMLRDRMLGGASLAARDATGDWSRRPASWSPGTPRPPRGWSRPRVAVRAWAGGC